LIADAECCQPLPASRPLRPNVTSSIKPEVHNVAQRRRRRTEQRPQGMRTQNLVPIGPVVPEICSRTDRRFDHNTPHPYRGGLCLKKVPTFKLSVTLLNLNRFSNFLHCWKAYEICYTTHTTLPTSP